MTTSSSTTAQQNQQQQEHQQHHDVYMTRHSARADKHYGWKPKPGFERDDTELSAGGEQASNELAARFNDEESIPLQHIVSSPFYRCLQTVAPIAKAKGLKIKVEPGICEILNVYPPGFWETSRLQNEFPGLIDMEYQPIMTRNDLSQEWGDGQAADRARRTSLAVYEKLQNNEEKPGPILFCGHGASCLGIAEAFGGSGYVGYSSFSHFRSLNNKWKVLQFGDVSHLSPQLRKQSLNSAW